MTSRWLRYWLPAALILAICVGPFLARGDQTWRDTRQQNQQAIAAMPPSEFERLQRNFKAFKQPGAEEKVREVRRLHQEITKDQVEGNGSLGKLMLQYAAWLKTIEPYQRDRLSQMKDPQERIALMQQVIQDQREQAANRAVSPWARFQPGGEGDHRREQPFRSLPGLNSDELKLLMADIEKRAAPRLSQSQQTELNERNGIERYVLLLRNLSDLSGTDPKPLFAAPPSQIAETAANIDQVLQNAELKEFLNQDLERRGGADPAEDQARLLCSVIFKSLMLELSASRPGIPNRPDLAKLREFFNSELTSNKQDELLELEASDFLTDLRNQYVSPRDIWVLFVGDWERGPGPGGRPGGFGRDRGPFPPDPRGGRRFPGPDGRRPPGFDGRPPFPPGEGGQSPRGPDDRPPPQREPEFDAPPAPPEPPPEQAES